MCPRALVNTYLPCVSESACNAAKSLVIPYHEWDPNATCTKRGWFSDTWYLFHTEMSIGCGFMDMDGKSATGACDELTREMDNATRMCFGEAGVVTEVEAVVEAMI